MPRSEPGPQGENRLLREGDRRTTRHTAYGADNGAVVAIDVRQLEEDQANAIEQSWANDIHQCFDQKASSLAIHTDVPRLVRKFSIINAAGEDVTPSLELAPMVPMPEGQVIPPNIGNDERMRRDEIIVLNFLLTLARTLNDEWTYDYIEKHFWNYFPYVPTQRSQFDKLRNFAFRSLLTCAVSMHS